MKRKSLRYIINRILDFIAIRGLLGLSGSRFTGISSALFLLAVHRMRTPAPSDKTSFNILILNKAMFNEDAMATFGEDPRFRLYGVHRQVIKALARAFFSPDIDDNWYVNVSKEDEANKSAYRKFAMNVLAGVLKRRCFDVVLTANYAYYAEREFAAACEQLGVAFIALHKENIRSPGFAEFMERVYRERRGPFTGRRVLVYNELEKSIEQRAGVAGSDRITVTGMPRMDRCHQHRKKMQASGRLEVPEPAVLLFSFGPKTLLPGLVRKMNAPPYRRYREKLEPELEKLGWHRLFHEVHRAMLKLALANPDIIVRIKTKGVSADQEVASVRQILGVDRLPDNLQVVFGGDPLTHIIRSAVVCGFNTTALLESVAVGVPAVVPRWAEFLDSTMQHYIVDFGGAVEYVESEEKMIARLAELARTRAPHLHYLTDAQSKMLDFWLGNADGGAGARVREAVLHELKQPRFAGVQ